MKNSKSPKQQQCRRLHKQALDLLEAGDTQGANKIMEGLLAGKPHDPWIDHINGFMLSKSGKQDEAIPLLRRAVQTLPSEAEFQITLGIALFRNREFAEAEKMHEEALATEPDSYSALTTLAGTWLSRDKWPERAEELLRRALKLNSDDEAVWALLGRALMLQGKEVEANEAFARAIRLDPGLTIAKMLFPLYPQLAGEVWAKAGELFRV